MKHCSTILILLVLLFSASCKKEATVPDYPVGKGRITGTTSTGISFSTEGANTSFTLTRASFSGWGNKDDLIMYAAVDLSIGRHFNIWMGAFDNREAVYQLNGNPSDDWDNVSFTQQFNPIQVEYRLDNPSGAYSTVKFTRIRGNYVEGTYFVRLANIVNGNPDQISIEGSFQGNLEIRQ